MSNVLRIAIVDPADASREKLKSMLLGMESIWLEAECSRYEFFCDVVTQTHPDMCIVSIDADVDRGLQLVGRLHEVAPASNVLVLSSSSDGNIILRAMRGGAREFLTLPIDLEDLVAALDRIGQHREAGGNRSRKSLVVAVAGATGGVGTTSIAVNVACSLARDPAKSVVLVDLDTCLGDADVYLDTIPDYTLVDVAQNVTRLDFSLLKRSLTKHSSGLFLLPRPVQLEDVDLVSPDDLQRVISLLKATFSHLIFDLSKSYTPLDRVALQMSDAVLLVTQLDLPCLRNVVRLVTSFGEMEGLLDKVKIVINRVGLEQGQISLKKAQETIGREIFWQVPNEYSTMVRSRNDGIPLTEQSPRAAITQSLSLLADTLAGEDTSARNPASKNYLSDLFSGLMPKRKPTAKGGV
jgi:pilus assembly protein CpaE